MQSFYMMHPFKSLYSSGEWQGSYGVTYARELVSQFSLVEMMFTKSGTYTRY